MRKIGKIVLGIVLVGVGLPLLAILAAVVWISALDRCNGGMVSSGETRRYLLHVPDAYDPARPTPLVISLHAGATWPAHQKNLSHWNRLADENGFIVVYPSGTPAVLGMARIWRTTSEDLAKDVQFVSDLIGKLEAGYNIDPDRIYVNGMSLGGGMAFALACMLSERIAAVGVVAAAQSFPSGWCETARPVPLMAFHGDADTIVPYGGGPLGDPFNPVKPVYFPVREWVAEWARRNGCAAEPVESEIAPDVVRADYTGCAQDGDVALFTLLGGGHSWPGGKPPPEWRVGPTNTSVDATSAMWHFFRQHPRPDQK